MNEKTVALLKSIFATDEEGNVYVRLVEGEPSGELKNSVSIQSSRSLETLLSSAIVLDSDGKPAIRIAKVEYGMTRAEADAKRIEKAKENEKERQARIAKSYEDANAKAEEQGS